MDIIPFRERGDGGGDVTLADSELASIRVEQPQKLQSREYHSHDNKQWL